MERRAIPGTKMFELLAAVALKHVLFVAVLLKPAEHAVHAVADVQEAQLDGQAVQLSPAAAK